MSDQNGCNNFSILETLESSIDRMYEARWNIQMMEEHYHLADQFRWSLNGFLRSLKEVVQLLSMELQNRSDLIEWFRNEKEQLRAEPLISFMYKQRDSVVHKSMLLPASKGFVGFAKGRGLKLGISFPIDARDDSRVAMLKYIDYAAEAGDFIGILYDEEDGSGEYSCVQREWRLDEFPDQELTELAGQAWERVASLTMKVATQLGAKVVEQKIELQNKDRVRIEIYDPRWIRSMMDEAEKHRTKS